MDYSLLLTAEQLYGKGASFCSAEFSQYAKRVMKDYNISNPKSVDEALELYFILLEDIDILS